MTVRMVGLPTQAGIPYIAIPVPDVDGLAGAYCQGYPPSRQALDLSVGGSGANLGGQWREKWREKHEDAIHQPD